MICNVWVALLLEWSGTRGHCGRCSVVVSWPTLFHVRDFNLSEYSATDGAMCCTASGLESRHVSESRRLLATQTALSTGQGMLQHNSASFVNEKLIPDR